MEHKELSFQEFEKAFKYIKVILVKIFKAYLEEAVFPEKLKIAKVIPVFKKVIKKILKTTDQFLFFQFFPKCLNVLCIIVCMNIS